jgi:hypothetical protein
VRGKQNGLDNGDRYGNSGSQTGLLRQQIHFSRCFFR